MWSAFIEDNGKVDSGTDGASRDTRATFIDVAPHDAVKDPKEQGPVATLQETGTPASGKAR